MFELRMKRLMKCRWAPVFTGILFLNLGAPMVAAQPCTEGVWTLVEPAVSPPPGGGLMVFDTLRGVAVYSSSTATWEWDGQTWSLRASGVGVPHGPMAFDSVRNVTVLFSQGVTWTWDGSNWMMVATTGPTTGGAMAFDTDRGVAVMHGGELRQTWEWNGIAWTFRFEAVGGKQSGDPQVRYGMSMCYDDNEHRTIMFGGTEGYSPVGETWAWDGNEWTNLLSGFQGRNDAPMTFDTARDRRVLFGGWDIGPGGRYFEFRETYESGAGMNWTLVDSAGPSARGLAAMTYDPVRNNIVLFGGYTLGSAFGDTWIRAQRPVKGGPSIVMQPEDAETVAGDTATFRVEAVADGTITYQWRKDGRAIRDSRGVIEGTRTNVLTIFDVSIENEGVYDVVVTNPCESVTSDPATLDVIGRCPADFNVDGVANSQDFFDFLIAFFELLPGADFDESGMVESADFFAFLDAFFGECA